MSALGHKQTLRLLSVVRFTPKSGHSVAHLGCLLCAKSGLMQCNNWSLLDHLVGAKQERFRDRKTERLSGLEVDD